MTDFERNDKLQAVDRENSRQLMIPPSMSCIKDKYNSTAVCTNEAVFEKSLTNILAHMGDYSSAKVRVTSEGSVVLV